MEGEGNKLEQINDIFSQFSEENKDKLLETAKRLLKAQEKDTASVGAFRDEVKGGKGALP